MSENSQGLSLLKSTLEAIGLSRSRLVWVRETTGTPNVPISVALPWGPCGSPAPIHWSPFPNLVSIPGHKLPCLLSQNFLFCISWAGDKPNFSLVGEFMLCSCSKFRARILLSSPCPSASVNSFALYSAPVFCKWALSTNGECSL